MKTVSSPPKTVRLQYGGSSLSLTSTQYSSSATCIKKKKKEALQHHMFRHVFSHSHTHVPATYSVVTLWKIALHVSLVLSVPLSLTLLDMSSGSCYWHVGNVKVIFFSIASSWKRSSCKAWALTMLQPCGLLDVNHVLMVPVTVCENLIRGPFDATDKKRHVARWKIGMKNEYISEEWMLSVYVSEVLVES